MANEQHPSDLATVSADRLVDHLLPKGVPGVMPFIDGNFVPPRSIEDRVATNPSTEEALYHFGEGSEIEVQEAVASGRRAFNDGRWMMRSPQERKRALFRLADLVQTYSSDLDMLDAEEMGKPVGIKLFSAEAAANYVRFVAEALDKANGEVTPSAVGSFVCQRLVPRGVVAAITPWNFPVYNVLLKVAPALAAGNSIVLKPSELASRSALVLASLAAEADIPPGAFNVVPGIGGVVGKLLAEHPDVDMLAFTGSSATGKLMLKYAAHSTMKPILAECGGKSPHIIFDDCPNVEEVAKFVAEAILVNQGQICSVGSRLLVHRSLHTRVVDIIQKTFEAVQAGDATSRQTSYGPMASFSHLQRIERHVDAARSELGEPVCGGITVARSGFFFRPTLFCNVRPSNAVAREEIFGPIMATMPFDTEDEAVAMANGTAYGLLTYVWTRNTSRSFRLIDRIRSGVVINASLPVGSGPGNAFSLEPARDSGVGIEGGMAGLASYLRRQIVWINHD